MDRVEWIKTAVGGKVVTQSRVIPQAKTVAKEFTCDKCGHKWKSRPYRFKDVQRDEPFKCPHCGSRYWWT